MKVSTLATKYGVVLTSNEKLVVFMCESKEMRLSSLTTRNAQEKFLTNADKLGIDTPDTLSEEEYDRIMEAIDVMYEAIRENIEEEFSTLDEEIKATKEAETFANSAKEKMERAANYMIKNIKGVGRILKEYNNFANMTDAEIEATLKENGMALFTRLKDAVAGHKVSIEAMKEFVNVDYDTEETENVLDVFRKIVDDDSTNGWGKFKNIVKVLIRYLLKIIIYVLHVILKIAITVTVGLIKMSAVALKVGYKSGKIVKKDVIDPGVKTVKKSYHNYKEQKEEAKETKRAEEYWADTLDESFKLI